MVSTLRLAATALALLAACSVAASAQSRLEAWGGAAGFLVVPPPPAGTSYVEAQVCVVQGGNEPPLSRHVVALRDDGEVVVFGTTDPMLLAVPPLPPGVRYVEVDAGAVHAIARRSDGVVVAWGGSLWGTLTPPALPPGATYVEIAAGYTANVARRSDGVLVTWGGGAPTPDLAPPGTSYTRIDAGYGHVLALRSDGQLLAWGFNSQGQTVVPPLPPGQRYVDLSAGMYHNLALRSDGALVAWGSNYHGACDVPPFPAGLAVTGLAAGSSYSAARLSDGSIQVWGTGTSFAQVPALGIGERFTQLSAGDSAFLGIVRAGVDFYGEGRVNSLGCVPAIGATGTPSATQSSGFTLDCTSVRNQALGMLMYTVDRTRVATPFQCGTRLVGPTGILRTPIRSAGGSPSGTSDCSGVFALDMNAYAAGAAGGAPSPLLAQPGTLVHAQWWGRDNGYAPPCNTMLSNAVEYVVLP